MTAAEAREKTLIGKTNAEDNEFNSIMQRISDACDKGFDYLEIGHSEITSQKVISKLKDNGFYIAPLWLAAGFAASWEKAIIWRDGFVGYDNIMDYYSNKVECIPEPTIWDRIKLILTGN